MQNIDLYDDLPKHLKCAICSQLLDDPIQNFDGLSACRKCYLKCIRMGYDEKDSQIRPRYYFEDRAKANEIANLMCFCKNRRISCSWTGKVKFLKDHERICKTPSESVCEFSTLITSINLSADGPQNTNVRRMTEDQQKNETFK